MKRFLLPISIALLTAGIFSFVVNTQWSLITLILLFLGAVLLISWLILTITKQVRFTQKEQRKAITKSLFLTFAVLAAIGLLNVLALRYPLRFDLSENQIFTLSLESQAIAKNLTQPLKVWIFDRSIDPETQTLLENYQRYGENFSYQLVDPEIEVSLAQQFDIEFFGDVYLEYAAKKQRLSSSVTPLGTNISEAQLANAIAKIQQNNTFYLYFLQGHNESNLNPNESDFSQAINELENKGYIVQPLDIASKSLIPEDADVIVIAKPLKKLSNIEVDKLQNYLQQGGNLLLMLMPNIDIGLEAIWQNWGIKLDNRLIIDGSAIGDRSPAIVIVNRYGDHPITSNFNNGLTIFPESRTIQTTNKDNIIATPLVITNENTWAESNLAQDPITFDPQTDLRGSFNLAIALSHNNESRMVVFGNAMFATNDWFNQQLNSDLFLNTVEWLAGTNQEILSIRSKELTNRRLNLTSFQTQAINWLAIRIFPTLSFISAVVVWWRKRSATSD